MKPSAQHIPYLDGLRASAALFVVLHHAWLQTWPKVIDPKAVPTGYTAIFTGWLAFGHLAVTVFIAISGFCLMLPILRGNGELRDGLLKFLERRAVRILPPYYVALFASTVIAGLLLKVHTNTLYDASLPVTLHGIVTHILLIQNFFSDQYQINGPLWSIAVEFQTYLFFPFLILLRRRAGMRAVLLATFIVGVGLYRLLVIYGLGDRTPHYIFVFALGMSAAQLAFQGNFQTAYTKTLAWSVLAGALACALVAHHFLPEGRSKDVIDSLIGIAASTLMYLAATDRRNIIARTFGWPPLAKIGLFSYSLYLIHFPLQQLLWQYLVVPYAFSRTTNFALVALPGTVIIVGLACGFYLLFERPFIALKPKTSAKREDTVCAVSS
jgi:peptidoglycan/LPS O-acetylase OafA/YrhL